MSDTEKPLKASSYIVEPQDADDKAFIDPGSLGLDPSLAPARTAFRGVGLPETAYTAGDTSKGKHQTAPTHTLLAIPPSRVIRRFSPANAAEAAGQATELPRFPTEEGAMEAGLIPNALYPSPASRNRNVHTASPTPIVREESSIGKTAPVAGIDPGAARLLALLGMPVPPEIQANLSPIRSATSGHSEQRLRAVAPVRSTPPAEAAIPGILSTNRSESDSSDPLKKKPLTD